MEAVVAPSAPGLPHGDDTAVKGVLTQAKKERRLTKAREMRKGPGVSDQDAAVKKVRLKGRAAVQKAFAENRRELDPQRVSNEQTLRAWFSKGYFQMELVENIPPGWLILRESNMGLPLDAARYAALIQLQQQAVALGLGADQLQAPPWYQVGILQYPPTVGLLKSVGFDLFVNFMGNKVLQHWAVEVSVAKELGIFVSGWVLPIPIVDPDWAAGGVGPYLYNAPPSGDDTAGEMAPVALAQETAREESYAEYMRLRMAQPGTYEADKQLSIAPPTIVEKSEGVMPPSVAAGNPGLEPIPEDPQEAYLQRAGFIISKVLRLAIVLTRENVPAGEPPKSASTVAIPDPEILDRLLGALRNEYTPGEDGRFTKLRADWEDFTEDEVIGVPPALAPTYGGAVVMPTELLEAAIRSKFNEGLEGMPYVSVSDSYYNPRTSTSDKEFEAALEAVIPNKDSGLKPPTQNPDPPPAAGQTVQEVQIASVSKAARMVKPHPSAFHTIMNYLKTTAYLKHASKLELDKTSFDEALKIMIPSVREREKYYFTETEVVPLGMRRFGFLTDNQNEVAAQTAFKYNGKSWFMEDHFVRKPFPRYVSAKFAVYPEDSQSLGFFGDKQLTHVYDHMVVKGNVMFSMGADKPIQFFPEQFCCSNVWWWESKLNVLPSTLRFHKVGSGGFNSAHRLVRTDGDELPDHFLFLPPTRVAYGLSGTEAGINKLFAPVKQNGILYRIAYGSADSDDTFGIQSSIRELMLAGYAASHGIGPKIFAAYIIPLGAYPPSMLMNPGDPNECFADPIHRPAIHQPRDPTDDPTKFAPPRAWYTRSAPWSELLAAHKPGFGTDEYNAHTPWTGTYGGGREVVTQPWKKMVVVMESFKGDMSKLSLETDKQKELATEQLFDLFDKMGEAGILHCDMKALNIVQRTWYTGKKKAKPLWNNLELRAIDFDPFFVKLVPWLPKDVVALINAAQYFASTRCFPGHKSLAPWAKSQLKARLEAINTDYPDGLAAVFRALKPTYSRYKGPDVINGRPNPHTAPGAPAYEIYGMFNDEFEAARAFRFWVVMYMENRCYTYQSGAAAAPPLSSMLSRLLAYVYHGDASKAKAPDDPAKPGNFSIEAQAAGVWGGMRWGDMAYDEEE